MEQPILVVENLTVVLPSEMDRSHAVERVSFELQPGKHPRGVGEVTDEAGLRLGVVADERRHREDLLLGRHLRVLEEVGHVAMLEAPEPTARAVLGMLEALPAD